MKTKLFFALTLIASFSCTHAHDEELTKELFTEAPWLDPKIGFNRLFSIMRHNQKESAPTEIVVHVIDNSVQQALGPEELDLAIQLQQFSNEKIKNILDRGEELRKKRREELKKQRRIANHKIEVAIAQRKRVMENN